MVILFEPEQIKYLHVLYDAADSLLDDEDCPVFEVIRKVRFFLGQRR